MSDLAKKYAESNPYDWMEMIRPADRVNLAKDAKKLANEVLELHATLTQTRAELERVVGAALEFKRRWCTAGQGNVDEAMDALFDLLPETGE